MLVETIAEDVARILAQSPMTLFRLARPTFVR